MERLLSKVLVCDTSVFEGVTNKVLAKRFRSWFRRRLARSQVFAGDGPIFYISSGKTCDVGVWDGFTMDLVIRDVTQPEEQDELCALIREVREKVRTFPTRAFFVSGGTFDVIGREDESLCDACTKEADEPRVLRFEMFDSVREDLTFAADGTISIVVPPRYSTQPSKRPSASEEP